MTSYKTIVRCLILNYISVVWNDYYPGWIDDIRFINLTISEDKCLFVVLATVTDFQTNCKYTITGEVRPSGSVFIDCVEIER